MLLSYLNKTPMWLILTLPLHVSLVLLPCLVVLHNYEFFVKSVFFQRTISVWYFTALSAISASCALYPTSGSFLGFSQYITVTIMSLHDIHLG